MSNVKTRAQIAREFGISRKTLYNWLKAEKLPIKGRLLSPKQQKDIYEKFGAPEGVPPKGAPPKGWRA